MAEIELYWLGAPRLVRAGEPAAVERRKALALLAYLSVTMQPHTRDHLAALLFPDDEPARAYAYLRNQLYTLRTALGESWLEADRDTVSFRPEAEAWVDVHAFREGLAEGRADAAALYRGEFLAGLTGISTAFDEWRYFEAKALRDMYAAALERQVAAAADPAAAIEAARRWVTADPLHEPAQRALIRLYAETGQRTAALRQYKELTALLARELRAAPEAETRALHEAILSGKTAARAAQPAAVVVAEAPPMRRISLPAEGTPFIGRERELEEIGRLLEDPSCRLVTLLGTGGIGKTRLALQAARQRAERYADGVCFVPLTAVTRPEQIIPAIAEALGFSFRDHDRDDVDAATQLSAFLSERHMLMVLDNCEQVVDGAGLVSDLLAGASHLTVLATSRERFNLREEWVYAVEGLAYPNGDRSRPFEGYAAVQLFVQSGQRARPDYRLLESDLPAVARIAKLVEGMPLGLELAAAWLQALSPEEIADEVARCLDFLSGTLRGVPERHRSLRAVFQSSWVRLSDVERRVLSQLSVFRGGFTREAAAAVAGAGPADLLGLTQKSLVRRGADGRYDLHELLRQFAAEKLADDRAVETAARDGHLAYYAAFLEKMEPVLKGHGQISALSGIEAESGNWRAAWEYAIERADLLTIGRMVPAVYLFLETRARYIERSDLIRRAYERVHDAAHGPDTQAALVKLMVWLAMSVRRDSDGQNFTPPLFETARDLLAQMDAESMALYHALLGILRIWPPAVFDEGEMLLDQAIRLCEQQGDLWGMAHALHALGELAHSRMQYERSESLFRRGLAICQQIGDQWGQSMLLQSLGEVAYTHGDYAGSEDFYRQSLALSRALEDPNHLSWSQDRIGVMLTAQGRVDEALPLFEEAIAGAEQLGDWWGMGWRLFDLGDGLVAAGRLEQGAAVFDRAIALFTRLNARGGRIWSWMHLSRIRLRQGNPAEAKRLCELALDLAHKIDNIWSVSAAHYHLSEALSALGDPKAALHHARESLRLAQEARSRMQGARHLVGWARAAAALGEPERALEALAFVIAYPASWYETREWAQALYDELAAELPPERVETLTASGRAKTLEALIAAAVES